MSESGPVATFPRGSSAGAAFARNQAIIRKASGEPPASLGRITWLQDPVDLRGLPAIGRGVAGVIRGTRPGANLE